MLILTKFWCCEIAKGIRKHVMKNRLTFSILLSTFNQTCAKAYCPLCPQILICKGASSSSSFSSFLFPSSSFPFSSLLIILSCPVLNEVFLFNIFHQSFSSSTVDFWSKQSFLKWSSQINQIQMKSHISLASHHQTNWLHSQFEGQRQPIRQPSLGNPQVDSLNTDGVIIQNKK